MLSPKTLVSALSCGKATTSTLLKRVLISAGERTKDVSKVAPLSTVASRRLNLISLIRDGGSLIGSLSVATTTMFMAIVLKTYFPLLKRVDNHV